MTLPTTISYDAPLEDLPQSRAPWQLDQSRSALLVHDMQRYFLRAYASECGAFRDAIMHTAQLIRAARAAGVPVFYTAQTGSHEHVARGLQADLWGAGMEPIAEHTEILGDVAPVPGDTVLVKHRYDAFAHSELAELLAAEGRDQLVICGVYAHIGVLATAFSAFQREVQPFVVADAVADLDAAGHRRALEQVAACCGVVTRTTPVMEAFEQDSPAFDAQLRAMLEGVLDAEIVAACLSQPDADWFELGLDSMRAFELLDLLADAGVDIDFGEFVRSPTLSWVREQAARQHALA